MENFRTPRKAPDALIEAIERALAPWIKESREHATDDPRNDTRPIALALSGGLDSSVLLHASARALQPTGRRLLAIHINHGLSAHADAWAGFCARQCETLGVAFVAVNVIVPRQASLEAAAREVRYQALADKALEHGAGVLLTAHHANDQAETVLLNALRGTGLAGLRGIAAERPLGQYGRLVMLRPFLEIEREALHEYATRQKLEWVEDDSNSNPRFRRNALRQQLMPALVAYQGDAIERLGSVARHAAASAGLLDELAAIDLLATLEDGGLALPRLAVLGRTRSANLLRYWLKREGYGVPSEGVLDEWLDQLMSGSGSLLLHLSGQYFTIQDDVLKPATLVPQPFAPPHRLTIEWLGEPILHLPDWHGALHFEAADGPGLSPERIRRELLSVRQRVGGERMQIAAHGPSRTLKNLYQEAGISASDRQALPLIYCGDDLLFAAGIGMNLRQCETGQQRLALRWVSAS